jgi:hypothetical protein
VFRMAHTCTAETRGMFTVYSYIMLVGEPDGCRLFGNVDGKIVLN